MAASASDDAADLDIGDDDFDLASFQADTNVQEALAQGTDLREYAQQVEAALRSVERESIQDYIGESESLAGLHTQIRSCDTVLDSMESMLRGFQGDLSQISAQIKFLQDESLSMNVKLRNRKAAETQLSSFIQQIVVPPDLITNICESEVNEAYLAYVVMLNQKVTFAKQESTAMTSACADMAPELEKLRSKSVQKIRDFLLQRVASLRKKMTNIQILQQSVLLKYAPFIPPLGCPPLLTALGATWQVQGPLQLFGRARAGGGRRDPRGVHDDDVRHLPAARQGVHQRAHAPARRARHQV